MKSVLICVSMLVVSFRLYAIELNCSSVEFSQSSAYIKSEIYNSEDDKFDVSISLPEMSYSVDFSDHFFRNYFDSTDGLVKPWQYFSLYNPKYFGPNYSTVGGVYRVNADLTKNSIEVIYQQSITSEVRRIFFNCK